MGYQIVLFKLKSLRKTYLRLDKCFTTLTNHRTTVAILYYY